MAKSVKLTCILQYQTNWHICGNISQTELYVATSVKLTRMYISQTDPNLVISVILVRINHNQWNCLVCLKLHTKWSVWGKISQTDTYVARSVKLTSMYLHHSNWPVYCNISQTDLYVAILGKLNYMWQNQSIWPVCSYISQTDPYIAVSVKLICMWQYQSNWTICGKINQTDQYVAVSVKLTRM